MSRRWRLIESTIDQVPEGRIHTAVDLEIHRAGDRNLPTAPDDPAAVRT
jgi:hypothetical protein